MSTVVQLSLPRRRLCGRVTLPYSKSLSNRQLILGAHTGRAFTIEGVSAADDTTYLIRALQQLGYGVARSGQVWKFLPPETYPPSAHLYPGEGGTTFRFLLPFLVRVPVQTRIDVGASLRRRPIFPLLHSLREAGAALFPAPNIYPIRIEGNPAWRPHRFRIDSSLSSQFISALMLMAPALDLNSEIQELASCPATPAYREMTRALLQTYGIKWTSTETGWQLTEKASLPESLTFYGEQDWSAASFFFGWAALGAFEGTLPLASETLQPEARLFSSLQWNCRGEPLPDGVYLTPTGESPEAIDLSVEDYPDAVLVLAVVAAFAKSPSRLRGIHTLPYKESDRLNALLTELAKIGAVLRIDGHDLLIEPTKAVPRHKLTFESYDDHRVAMALSLIAARAPEPIYIKNPYCVLKSFGTYWKELERLGAQCEFL